MKQFLKTWKIEEFYFRLLSFEIQRSWFLDVSRDTAIVCAEGVAVVFIDPLTPSSTSCDEYYHEFLIGKQKSGLLFFLRVCNFEYS